MIEFFECFSGSWIFEGFFKKKKQFKKFQSSWKAQMLKKFEFPSYQIKKKKLFYFNFLVPTH